jgi:hypothetical protein
MFAIFPNSPDGRTDGSPTNPFLDREWRRGQWPEDPAEREREREVPAARAEEGSAAERDATSEAMANREHAARAGVVWLTTGAECCRGCCEW